MLPSTWHTAASVNKCFQELELILESQVPHEHVIHILTKFLTYQRRLRKWFRDWPKGEITQFMEHKLQPSGHPSWPNLPYTWNPKSQNSGPPAPSPLSPGAPLTVRIAHQRESSHTSYIYPLSYRLPEEPFLPW
ncbi:hypothetical protein BDZ91DRAFT_346472 [Kalaharituber pfeilii]|nr:hypothetical protein BDZ91DRAFT_346472 [Kalaharituber pfeilii]